MNELETIKLGENLKKSKNLKLLFLLFFEFTRQKGTKPKTDFWRENSNILMTYLSY